MYDFFMNECCLCQKEQFDKWIVLYMLLLLGWFHFSIEKLKDPDVFDECDTTTDFQGKVI